ncbi:hypothetical protein NA57DRAFT_61726 [Rhizodiscina lignyota]|uniref:BTB domain-containing protein n=1 Tax=Rhizodiscina lignyota TaxID=1504668 RepID=A0A9P4I3T8_9PEZI|nr:hypothetical protein NA57DRAFT_61726 [Rhizodiscina lignyota]
MDDESKVVEIVTQSNLTLIVGEGKEKVTFKVIRDALRLASPIWNVMFDPDKLYIEGNSNEVCLPKDDTIAMETVLQIAHLRFQEVPTTFDSEELFNLAILCDKYDNAHLIAPFLDKRSFRYFQEQLDEGGGVAVEAALVAWTFGDRATLAKAMPTLITRTDLSRERPAGQEGVYDGLLPPALTDYIKRERDSLFHWLKREYQRCTDTLSCDHFLRGCRKDGYSCITAERVSCCMMQLGYILRCVKYECPGLEESELRDEDMLEDYVQQLLSAAQMSHGIHDGCKPGFLVETLRNFWVVVPTGSALPIGNARHGKACADEMDFEGCE